MINANPTTCSSYIHISTFINSSSNRACKEKETGRGPVTVRTPFGLGVDEWAEGLEKYAKTYQALDGIDNYDIKK